MNQMQKSSEDILHVPSVLAFRMLHTSRGILQAWPLCWVHFQQFVQFVKSFGSFNHVKSSTTPSWRVKAKEGPALPQVKRAGQSHGETLHPCEEPSENSCYQGIFYF